MYPVDAELIFYNTGVANLSSMCASPDVPLNKPSYMPALPAFVQWSTYAHREITSVIP